MNVKGTVALLPSDLYLQPFTLIAQLIYIVIN